MLWFFDRRSSKVLLTKVLLRIALTTELKSHRISQCWLFAEALQVTGGKDIYTNLLIGIVRQQTKYFDAVVGCTYEGGNRERSGNLFPR